MRPSQLFAAVVALSSVTAAFPDVFENVKAIADVNDMLYRRQDNSESAQPSSEASRSTDDSRPSNSEASQTAENTGRETEEASGTRSGARTTGRATGTARNTRSGRPTATRIDPNLPAGGISMVTPSAIAGPQYYKIGDWVSFAWNYTSLSVTPSAIDILATCTANQATYTLAVNQSVEETGMVYWDTGAYQATASVPLLTETYTLLIYDANSSVSAMARPGYLGVFNQFRFGMYTPQPYTPWADYQCPTCNSALSPFEQLTLKALLVTGGTTIFSLLYFGHSFGIW